MNNKVKIYTDGACPGNHLKENKGGYGAVIMKQGEEPLKISGGYQNTTNNRMELKAAIEALKRVPISYPVTVYSDSQYVITGITVWIHNWIKQCKVKDNWDLWMELHCIVSTFQDIQFIHVKGHMGNEYNEEADKLAVKACNYPNLPIDRHHE